MIGRTVARYHILGKLGEGGMASVWRAKDKLLDRTVALKFLPESLASSADARRRFRHEARAASCLEHPGIAQVFDAGEADGFLYIAYAYVDGRTVSELVAGGPLLLPEAVRIACATAEALAHAHGRGVLHRDISAGNIMVARDGAVKVVDFGLARETAREKSRVTRTGEIPGTLDYMAPEVLMGHDADARADLYGLGAVLYEMITGVPPFRAPTRDAVGYQTVHEKPQPPSARRPEVSRRLDRLVLRLLEKDPGRRYQGAGDVARDLRASLALGADRVAEAPAAVPVAPRVSRRAAAARAGGRRLPRARAAEARVAPRLPEAKILAVLPFRDASAAGEPGSRRHVFARGLAEAVSARLARSPDIQVIPPSAVPSGGRREDAARGLARQLGANLLLSGCIQRVGSKVRITFALFDAESGIQRAGETLNGSVRGILALEDRLVRNVVRALELQSAAAAAARPAYADPAAHEHYLQALGYLQSYENAASVDGAIALLEPLVQGSGNGALVGATLGRAYLCKYSLTLDPRWTRSARSACERALKLDPREPRLRVTLAELHVEAGRHAQAIREFRRALRGGLREPDVLLGLGMAQSAAGELEAAERTYREAIALRPSYWAGYNRLGVLCFKEGRFEEAARLWRRVTELAPGNARGFYNLGGAYYCLGRHQDAIAAYRRSLEIMPSGTAYSSLGTVHFFLGDYQEAAAMFEKGAALKPFDPVKWGNLGDAYRWIQGKDDEAAAAFDQAIRLMREQLDLNPRDGKHWAELAAWLAKRGRTEDALNAVRKGLRLSPKDVSCMALAGRVYHLAGSRNQALEWLARAVEHGYDATEFQRDPELAMLRDDPRFVEILKERQAM